MIENVIMALECGPLSRLVIYIAEVKHEREGGKFPVGYYKARRKKIGAIRQDVELKAIAEKYLEDEDIQCAEYL